MMTKGLHVLTKWWRSRSARLIVVLCLSLTIVSNAWGDYTVSFSVGYGTAPANQTTSSSITLPNIPNLCDDAIDAGWMKYGWSTTSVAANSSSATIVGTQGATYSPSSNITLHAVYKQGGETLTSATAFSLHSSSGSTTNMPTSGQAILTQVKYGTSAIGSTINRNYIAVASDVSIPSGKSYQQTDNANAVWTISNPATGVYTFQNLVTGQYLGVTSTGNGALLDDASTDYAKWEVETTGNSKSDGFYFKNKGLASDNYLTYSSGSGWKAASKNGTTSNVYLWMPASTVSASSAKYQSSLSTWCSYHVYYDANGGSGTMTDANNYDFWQSVTVATNTFTAPTGYSFAYWTADYRLENDEDEYYIDDPIAEGKQFYMPAASVTLTAQWKANETSITLNKGDGTADGTASVYYDATELDEIEHATNSDGTQHLVGYYTNDATPVKVLTSNGTFAATNITGYVTSGKWSNTSSAITLYAHWATTTYTVTFNMHEHGSVDDQEVATGQVASQPSDPEVDGYRFLGWYKDDEGEVGEDEFDFSSEITANTTIHAKWAEITYSSTYRAWCDPDITITGNVYLTSVKDTTVYTTSGTRNLLKISSTDLAGVNKLDIQYVDADNADALIDKKSNSLFRLCNDGVSPANYTIADGGQIDVSATNTCDMSFSIRYKPTSYDVINHYKLQITMKRNTRVVKTVTHDLYGHSLPDTFVIAAKINNQWYALPADLSTSFGGTTKEPYLIAVDNASDPTIATLVPSNARYTGGARKIAGTNIGAIGLKSTVTSNFLTAPNSASETCLYTPSDRHLTFSDWYIISTGATFKDDTIRINPDSTNSRGLKVYGSKIGYYSGEPSRMRILPIEDVATASFAEIEEWFPDKVRIHTTDAISSAQTSIGGAALSDATVTSQGTNYYDIATGNMIAQPARTLAIKYTTEASADYAMVTVVPLIINTTKGSSDVATNYSNIDLVVRDRAVYTINSGTQTHNTYSNVWIYPTGKVVVPDGKTLQTGSLNLLGGIDWIGDGAGNYTLNKYGVPEFSLKGDLKNLASTPAILSSATYYMRTDENQYYMIATPSTVAFSDVKYADGTSTTPGTNIWMIRYDGASRASRMGGDNWVDEVKFSSHSPAWQSSFERGMGYWTGATPQNEENYALLKWPVSLPESDLNVDVTYHGAGTAAAGTVHAGWNFIANPFTTTIKPTQLTVHPESGADKTYEYVIIPDESHYTESFYDAYYVNATGGVLKPFKSFFVQVDVTGTLTFANSDRQAPIRRLGASEDVHPEVFYAVNLTGGTSKAGSFGIRICDTYTEEYEIGKDLEYMTPAGHSAYTLYNGLKLKYNALSTFLAQVAIPVGYTTREAGEFTFTLDPYINGQDLEHVYLTDYEQEVTVDLVDGAYTFTTEAVTGNETRFAISTVVGEHRAPTGTDLLEQDSGGGGPVKFIYHDRMYILNDNIIYDATGKRVKVLSNGQKGGRL